MTHSLIDIVRMGQRKNEKAPAPTMLPPIWYEHQDNSTKKRWMRMYMEAKQTKGKRIQSATLAISNETGVDPEAVRKLFRRLFLNATQN